MYLILLVGPLSLTAQIDLTYGGTPSGLAERITGNGVQILNPVITCSDSAIGTYDIAESINFPAGQGVIMSTGNINGLLGPNDTEAHTTIWNSPGDSLITIIGGQTSFDACALEFDIVPAGDTLRFDFTFASEEYAEYVGTPFNDIFGFFISGPGIVGDPGLGGRENIALIPNTNTPVGISTVNNGNPDIGFPPTNAQYFEENPLGLSAPIQFDGWTKGLYAEKIVQPCDTFRLKLVIADVADPEWDSAVLIESIESNNISLTAATAEGIESTIEGCNPGTVTFTRTPVTADPVTVSFFVQGTATNGVDYQQIGADPDPQVAKTITIPANEASATIDIIPFDDGLDEGTEYIEIFLGNPLCPGTIQDQLTISIKDSLEVAVVPPLSFVCAGDDLTFSVVGDDSASYSWSPSDFLDDPNIKEPTTTPQNDITYTLTATAGACVSSTTVEVQVSDVQLSVSTDDILCAGQNDGAIDLSISGGQSPYDIEWTGPFGFTSAQEDLSGLNPGTYNVLVTDREGCTASLSVTIQEVSAMDIEVSSPEYTGGDNVSCFSASDGQATATVLSGGTPPFTYAWDDPANQTGQTATGLSAGTYSVVVTDANGCQKTELITLSSPDPVTALLDDRQDVSCHGGATGSATISPQGGHGPYTVVWNTVPAQFGLSLVGVSAGIYIAEITDVNGCQGTIEVEIEQPDSPLSGSVAVTHPLCAGEETGSAVASISGGTAPYTYLWSADLGNDAPQITGLAEGNHALTVTDANGCELTIPFNINAPDSVHITVTDQNPPACHGEQTGSITVSASGGTAPYSYIWNTTPATAGPFVTGLGEGSYTVTVEDANGCTEQLTVELQSPDSLELSVVSVTEPQCHGDANGSVEVVASGGTAPYDYSWNTTPPTSGPVLNGLEAGTYTATVTDANGCTATLEVVVSEPAALDASIASITHVLCAGDNTGEITIVVSGGTPTYAITWDDPSSQTGTTATNLATGTYTATIVDAAGCTLQIAATITEPTDPLGGQILSTDHVACFGESTGSATVTGTGGSGSYSYQWDDPANQQTSTATGLAPGTYHVTITDNNGCGTPVVIDVVINGPSQALSLNLTPSVYGGGYNVACADDSTATIDLTIVGGTAPYDVLWNLPGLDTSTDEDLSNLAPGTYSVTVTDANGCEANESITLTAPSDISITFETTPSLCFGIPSGSLSIQIFGGVPGYDVLWNGPNGFTSTQTDLTDIEGGIYQLTITDANGCIYMDAVTVAQPDDLVITVDSISDYNGFNTTCYNSHDGAVYITPSGGTPPYSHQWNTAGNPNFSNQEDVTNLAPGTYETVLIDDNGCVQNEFVDIVGPDTIGVNFDLSLYPNGFNISCFGAADGSIEAFGTGGTPGYTYVWAGPAGYGPVFDNPISGLQAGEYNVLVRDSFNCVFTETVTLTEPEEFNLTLVAENYNGSDISCVNAADGVINLIIDGSGGPYDILWTGPNGFTSTDEDLFGLATGNYCVTVTDAADCQQTECIELVEPQPITIALDETDATCDGVDDGAITATIAGGTGAYQYSWTGPNGFTANSQNLTQLAAGQYCIEVTDANGCTATECAEILAPAGPSITLDSISDISCAGDATGSIDISVSTTAPPAVIAWTGPNGFTAATEDISNLTAGTYCVEVTDANSCTTQACYTVSETSPLTASGVRTSYEGGFNIDCHGNDNGGIYAGASGGTAPYTYSWTGPDGFTASSQLILNLAPGIYCLTVEDANGCTFTDCTQITEPTPLESNPTVTLPQCGEGGPATVNLNVGGGVGPYSYNWSSGDSTETVSLDEGNYTVIITDANGCETVEIIDIQFPEELLIGLESPFFSGGVNIVCHDGSTGSIDVTVFNANGNVSYSWTGPDGFTSTNEDLTGLSAGEYCVTAVDDLGCEATSCITLIEPDPIVIDLNATSADCAGQFTGAIEATVTGGIPTHSISWSGPNGFTATGTSLSDLEAGNYCATVTDLNGCTAVSCIDVTEPSPLDIDLTATLVDGYHISCFGDNSGEITSTVSGGTAPYAYAWTGPNGYASDEENPVNLYAGEYCLEITDDRGCVTTSCITLTEAPGVNFTLTPTTYPNGYNTTCGSACDGAIDATLSGGNPPLTLAWTGPNGFTAGTEDITGLCAGTYTLTTTDDNGCVQSASVTLTGPELLNIILDSPEFNGGLEVSCHGANTGSINANVNGGNGGLTYSWSGPDGFVSADTNLVDLFAGTYTLTVTDSVGCTTTASIDLEEPAEALAVLTTSSQFPSGDNISCHGADDATIDVATSGGTEPYDYNWNGPDGFSSDQADLSNLAPGLYTLVVEDANSCVFTTVVEITEPDSAISVDVSAEPLLCAGDDNGSIEVTASGGSDTLTIFWIGPDGFSADEFAIDSLAEGTYSYVVEDINGCSVGGSYNLVAPTPISISGTTSPAGCADSTGFIDVTIQGGTAPYGVLWSTADTAADLTGLPAGEYIINVTDANGCMAADTFVVDTKNDLVLEATLNEPECHGDQNGSIQVTSSGGGSPVSYQWTGPEDFTASGDLIGGLFAGEYTVTATAANGCQVTETYELEEPDSLFISEVFSPVFGNGHNVSTFQGSDGIIEEPEITGGTEPYHLYYFADNGYAAEGFGDKGGLEAGWYTIVVLDAHLCEDTVRLELTEPVPIELPNGISPNGDGFNDYLKVRGLEDFPVNRLLVFNRWGNQVYEESNYRNDDPWYGTNQDGEELPEGTYFVIVELEGHDNLKAYLEIRR